MILLQADCYGCARLWSIGVFDTQGIRNKNKSKRLRKGRERDCEEIIIIVCAKAA